MECDFSFALSHEPVAESSVFAVSSGVSHEPAGGKIECDFSEAFSHDPAGGKMVCDAVLTSCINNLVNERM